MNTKKTYHTKNINLGRAICEYLDALAEREDRSVSAVVRRMVIKAMALDAEYHLPEDEDKEATP